MKILFLTHGADMMGANRSLIGLMKGLKGYGVENVVLIPQDGELAQNLDKHQIDYIIAPYYHWAFTKYLSKGYWLNFWYQQKNKQCLKHIVQKVEGLGIDVVYSNSSIIGMGAQLAEALQLPHVWHIREFGEKDYSKSYWGGRKHFNQWANKAAAIIAISKAINKEVLSAVTAPKHIIYNGIMSQAELEAIAPNQTHAQDPFTFLIIGLIHPTKRQLLALKAFHQVHQKHPNTRLLIVGKGRRLYTQQIKNYIRNHKLEEAAQFLGYVSNPDAVHQQADCVLMCSLSEGMGRVTVEGMIYGNPVIGYQGGATPELISHEKEGLLFSDGVEELAACMQRLVADRPLAAKLGQAGRKKAAQAYTTEQYVESIHQVLVAITS